MALFKINNSQATKVKIAGREFHVKDGLIEAKGIDAAFVRKFVGIFISEIHQEEEKQEIKEVDFNNLKEEDVKQPSPEESKPTSSRRKRSSK